MDVSIAQLISGSQCHSEGPKKCSDFSIQEPLLSWMGTSSSVKGEDEAYGVCLCGMKLSSGEEFLTLEATITIKASLLQSLQLGGDS